MDGGAWQAIVHGVAKSRTRLSDFTFPFHFDALEKEMAAHSSVLAWRIPGTGEPGGLPSMGWHGVGHDWRDLAAEELILRQSRVLGVSVPTPKSQGVASSPSVGLSSFKSGNKGDSGTFLAATRHRHLQILISWTTLSILPHPYPEICNPVNPLIPREELLKKLLMPKFYVNRF